MNLQPISLVLLSGYKCINFEMCYLLIQPWLCLFKFANEAHCSNKPPDRDKWTAKVHSGKYQYDRTHREMLIVTVYTLYHGDSNGENHSKKLPTSETHIFSNVYIYHRLFRLWKYSGWTLEILTTVYFGILRTPLDYCWKYFWDFFRVSEVGIFSVVFSIRTTEYCLKRTKVKNLR